jgi:hypothetical protein
MILPLRGVFAANGAGEDGRRVIQGMVELQAKKIEGATAVRLLRPLN